MSNRRGSFVLVPRRGGRGLLVQRSAAARRAARRELSRLAGSYGRFCRWGFGVGFDLLLPSVALDSLTNTRELVAVDALPRIRAALGQDVSFLILRGTESPARKSVAVAVDGRGDVVAYAKIGVPPIARRLVQREAAALGVFASMSLRGVRVPDRLGLLADRDSAIVLLEPLAFDTPPRHDLTAQHVRAVSEIARRAPARRRFGATGFCARLLRRFDRHLVRFSPADQATLCAARDLAWARLDRVALPYAMRIGDFAPWNIGAVRDGYPLPVVDLEYAQKGGSLGWDLFHFLNVTRGPAAPLPRDVVRFLGEHGADPDLARPLRVAYLLDHLLHYRQMWGDRRPSKVAVRGFAAMVAGLRTVLAS